MSVVVAAVGGECPWCGQLGVRVFVGAGVMGLGLMLFVPVVRVAAIAGVLLRLTLGSLVPVGTESSG